MKQTIIIFSALSVTVFLLFQLSKYSLNSFVGTSSDFFILFAALLFIIVGFYINRILFTKSSNSHSKILKSSILSKQERKILALMSDGLSNGEIGENLFIAESTVKKHVSNILNKLKAKRRTEAVRIGRDLDII